MPLTDPNILTSADWVNLHNWLTMLWIFFPLMITFAFCMMIANGFIPSGVMTGDYPPVFLRLRLPLIVIGLVALVVALVLFISASFLTPEMLNLFWNQFFV